MTQTFTRTIEIGGDRRREIDRLLESDRACPQARRDDVIETFSADFGGGVEADIKLVNSDSGPYIDPVLFDGGCEVAAGEPAYSLGGGFQFEYDGRKFLVEIEERREP